MEIYEKYGRTERWTSGQLHNREGVSIDNDDCNECKIGGNDPKIVDNRKKDGGGSNGSGASEPGSGGGEDGNGSGGAGNGTGADSGGEGGAGPGTGDEPGPDVGIEPGTDVIDPGYGLPEITVPLPDIILPNGDGSMPWDYPVGFETSYSRVLYLLSGDMPKDVTALANEIKGFATDFATGNNRIVKDFESMWKSIKDTDWQNAINKGTK